MGVIIFFYAIWNLMIEQVTDVITTILSLFGI